MRTPLIMNSLNYYFVGSIMFHHFETTPLFNTPMVNFKKTHTGFHTFTSNINILSIFNFITIDIGSSVF